MIRKPFAPGIVVLLGLCAVCPALGYQMTSWVASGGAHTGSSVSYQMAATLGQPSPIGISTGGASYDMYHGFWHTVSGPPPLTPVLHIARLNATQAELWWNAIAGATAYRLYRGTAASFVPGTHWQQVTGTSHTFSQGIGDPLTNYFFLCRSVGAWGESDDSNRVGEFDFGTTATEKTAEGPFDLAQDRHGGRGAEGQQ
jgi:hypothetical protein